MQVKRRPFSISTGSCLPGMKKAVTLRNLDRHAEEGTQPFAGQQYVAAAIGHNAAFCHKDHAFDLRQNVGEMMRDQQDAGACLGHSAQNRPQFALRREIQCISGFI